MTHLRIDIVIKLCEVPSLLPGADEPSAGPQAPRGAAQVYTIYH